MKMTNQTAAQFKKYMGALTVPKGFTFKVETEDHGFRGMKNYKPMPLLHYTLESAGERIEFWQGGKGRTSYLHNGFWANFDRTGVEDSFYHLGWDGEIKQPPNTIVREQLERIAKRREYLSTAVKIPEVGYTVPPAGVEPLKQQLTKRGVLHFTPSGFGTGYCLTTKRTRQHDCKRASAALEKWFEISPLFISTFDAD